MRQLAVYGKGGIGKSMVSSHISFALADQGKKVMHVGCDPKHDSTRLLLNGRMPTTILDVLRERGFDTKDLRRSDIVFESPFDNACGGEVFCAESGGPEAGSGCGGRGVTEAINTLKKLNVYEELGLDAVVYDVLGDVVCGGFAMPIRKGHAREVYVVTSGELQALFAACNVFRAVARFAARSGTRLGGIIGNLRDMVGERELLTRFAEYIGTEVVGFIPYSPKIKAASGKGMTLFQYAPESEECAAFRALAERIENNDALAIPRGMTFDELHAFWKENKHLCTDSPGPMLAQAL